MIKAFKYAVVLTGSIATGKSTTSKIFSNFGYDIIDADFIAHQVLEREKEGLIKIFGKEALKNNKVNRKYIGIVIFSNKEKKKELEEFIHPIIYKEIEKQSIEKDKLKKTYLIDIPLFYENNNYNIDRVIVVYSTKERQLNQLMTRNGYSHGEALTRINSQISIDIKKEKATYVINNIKDLSFLEEEVKRVIKEIA